MYMNKMKAKQKRIQQNNVDINEYINDWKARRYLLLYAYLYLNIYTCYYECFI